MQHNIRAFEQQLAQSGISHDTVDDESVRGSGCQDPVHESSWKRYYRSSQFPELGVLLAPDDLYALASTKLESERASSLKLAANGVDVPCYSDKVIQITDHLRRAENVAAIVVEHIDANFTIKLGTAARSLSKILSDAPNDEVKGNWIDAWSELGKCLQACRPRDHQVLFEKSGRIVTIDAEQVSESAPEVWKPYSPPKHDTLR